MCFGTKTQTDLKHVNWNTIDAHDFVFIFEKLIVKETLSFHILGAMSDKEYIVEEDSSWITNAALSMPVANVAKLMLDCLQTNEYDKKIIGIGLHK